MTYLSTRDAAHKATAAQAIVTGLAPDGGLYVPQSVPSLDIKGMQGQSYQQVAFNTLSALLEGFDENALKEAIDLSYGANFNHKVGALVSLSQDLHSLELWHGPTAAFKDYALQLMPRLLVQAKEVTGNTQQTLILVATSGDTGKAALEGFKDVKGTGICVFYPNQGISKVQRLQMDTQEGQNVAVYAIEGNFDDAQQGVKEAFSNEAMARALAEKNTALSSANSINWGRLAPQIVYYITSYLKLCDAERISYGDPVDFCVPTGNFGDILAGYYAKQMGLPVGTLICASNKNNVLTEFFETGLYDVRREFYKTSSPSMDILISSNLERLLFHASGNDADRVKSWMSELAEDSCYQIDDATLSAIQKDFAAAWTSEAEVATTIKDTMAQYNYLCDPHTAVALHAAQHVKRDEKRPVVVLSTADPYKFSGKVLESLEETVPTDEFEALDKLHDVSGLPIPDSIRLLQAKEVRFTTTIPSSDIQKVVQNLEV